MLCKYDIFGALCELCRRMALVKIPKYCYGEEIKKIRQVGYEDAISESEERFALEDDQTLIIREFEETLTKQELIACRMKQRGYTNREIIPYVGAKSDTQVSRLMKGLQNKMIQFLLM